jgi:hypothetical protein
MRAIIAALFLVWRYPSSPRQHHPTVIPFSDRSRNHSLEHSLGCTPSALGGIHPRLLVQLHIYPLYPWLFAHRSGSGRNTVVLAGASAATPTNSVSGTSCRKPSVRCRRSGRSTRVYPAPDSAIVPGAGYRAPPYPPPRRRGGRPFHLMESPAQAPRRPPCRSCCWSSR